MFAWLTRKPQQNDRFLDRLETLEHMVRQLQRENTELRLDMDNLREKVMRRMSGAGRPRKTENDLNEYDKAGVIPWPQSS